MRGTWNIVGGAVAVFALVLATVAASIARDDSPRVVEQPAPSRAVGQPAALVAQPTVRVVAPGLVEPISEEIEIASDVIGRLKSVPVQEGDSISRGQVLAEIENADLKAALAVAEANVDKQQALLDKLKNGARPEEREQAAAELQEAQAREAQAQRDLARKSPLAAVGVESRSKLDDASATAAATSARRLAAAAQQALIDGAPRAEDIRIAEAELAQAQANVAEIQAQIDKTIIRSPIDGVVLSRQRKTGEAVANLPPTIIMHIGDISRLRVRADVDETDIARVAVGQRVSVRADAYGERRFGGTIVRLAASLGRKNFRTERPTEKVDTKILETLIDLDPDVRLPVGLRVDVLDESGAQIEKQPDAISASPTAAPAAPATDSVRQTVASAEDEVAPAIAIQPFSAPEIEPREIATLNPPETLASDPQQPSGVYGAPIDSSRIVLSATEDDWVQVKDDVGNPIFTRVLKAGERYGVPDRKGLTLIAGNAAGLLVTVDGNALPPLGKQGHVVRDVKLDPNALSQRVAGVR